MNKVEEKEEEKCQQRLIFFIRLKRVGKKLGKRLKNVGIKMGKVREKKLEKSWKKVGKIWKKVGEKLEKG